MQLPVSAIRIEKRVRNDLGELGPLMESMRKHGQLNPVVITADDELIAGHRRLESARRLGWACVEAVRLDQLGPVEKLELEMDENILRKDLTPEEIREGNERLEKLRNPSLFTRIGAFFRRMWKKLFGRRTRGERES